MRAANRQVCKTVQSGRGGGNGSGWRTVLMSAAGEEIHTWSFSVFAAQLKATG